MAGSSIETIKYDLRSRHGTKKHFSINDIHYSVEQNKNEVNVTKAIIIEKQPLYPLYTADGYDAVYNLGSALKQVTKNIMGGGVASTFLGSVGSKGLSQGVKALAVGIQNTNVDKLSSAQGNSAYFNNDNGKYADIIKNLFKTGTNSYIASYELPFFSDYFFEADGNSGWVINGVEAMIGQFSKIANYLSIGYPVTPNWKYESKRLRTEFAFNLINDTTENLINNLRLITTMLPGMMHVLIDGSEVAQKVSEKFGSGTIGNMFKKLTTMFKSPNVYEVIVPGRFRWMWCTMIMDVKYAGKIFNDTVTLPYKVFDGNPELIGFPEVFKITITVESLLPQSFNEFYYFLTQNDFSKSGYINSSGNVDTTDDSLGAMRASNERAKQDQQEQNKKIDQKFNNARRDVKGK